MRLTTTIVLLVAALLLAGYLLLGDLSPATPDAGPPRPLASFDARRVNRLEITSSHGRFTLAHEGGTWRLSAPGESAPVEASREALASILAEVEALRSAADVKEDGSHGLDEPRATMRLISPAGTVTIRLGADHPLGEDLYAGVEGTGRSILARKKILALVDKVRDELREREILPVPPYALSELELERDGESISLRKESGSWLFLRPIRGRADPERVLELLNALTSCRAVAFVDDAPESLAVYGLDPPRFRARLRLQSPAREVVLRIGGGAAGEPDSVYLHRDGTPTVFAVPASITASLSVPVDSLRDRRLVLLGPEKPVRLVLASGERVVEIERVGESWTVVKPAIRPAETSVIEDLVDRFRGLRAAGFASGEDDRSAMGLDPPAVRIELEQEGVDGRLAVRLGAETAGGELRWARSVQMDAPARVRVEDVAPFLKPAFAYESRLVLGREGHAVKAIAVSRAGTEFRIVRETAGGADRFHRVPLAGPKVEMRPSLALEIFDALAPLAADAYVADGNDPAARREHGLDAPEIVLRIDLAAPEGSGDEAGGNTERRRIAFGRRDDTLYGLMDGDGRIFVPGSAVRRALESILEK
jgi:hypothetical protein